MTPVERHIDSFSLRLESMPAALLVLLAAAACALAWWYYRNPAPPISSSMRRLLTILRASTLVLLTFSLSEPVFRIVFTTAHPQKTVVLVDTSSSMAFEGDPERVNDAKEALAALRSRLGNRGAFFSFDSRIRPLKQDEPSFDGEGTDIAAALKHAFTLDDAAAVVLVGDGRWNLGEDPAMVLDEESLAVHTVLAGSLRTEPDIVLGGVSTPPAGRDGKAVDIDVTVALTGRASGTVCVDILEHGKAVAGGKAVLDGPGVVTVPVTLKLAGIGTHTYTAVASPPFAERTENNARPFSIRVLKSAFAVLIIAPAPSLDLAFIRRATESDSALTVRTAISSGGAAADRVFPDRLDQFDAAIVIDGGGTILDASRAQSLATWLSGGKGLLVAGSAPFPEGSPIAAALPVAFNRTTPPVSPAGTMALTSDGERHFITASAADRTVWSSLPPAQSCAVTKPSTDARVLATTGAGGTADRIPALVAGVNGRGRTVALPVTGIWRWRLMMEGAGKGTMFFDTFLRGTIRWLASETDMSPLSVTTDAGTYLNGQEARFEARIFDSVYMPVSGGSVTVQVDNDPALNTVLDETTPGIYKGAIRGIPPGAHTWTVSSTVGGARYADASGTFTIEKTSIESLDFTSDPATLGALASKTGGLAVTTAGVDSLLGRLPSGSTSERGERNHPFTMNPLAPALAIALLTIEWFLRKRRGMI